MAENENKNVQQKSSTKKALKFTALLYVALLIIGTTFTFGWFIINNQVSIKSGGNINISSKGATLEIAFVGADDEGKTDDELDWGNEFEFDDPVPQNFVDITGNGEELWWPDKLDETNERDVKPYIEQVKSFQDVLGNSKYYKEFRIRFRTSFRMDLYLNDESYIQPKELPTGKDKYDRKSLLGNFSCDGIAGAVRVAFLEPHVDENSGKESLELKNLWIPNDKYELWYDDEGAAHFVADGVREKQYSYIGKNLETGTYEKVTYTNDDYAQGNVCVGNKECLATYDGVSGTVMVNHSRPLLSFDNSDNEITKELVVRVWTEGCDREADSALNGGMFKYKFEFVGVNKDGYNKNPLAFSKYVHEKTAEVDRLIAINNYSTSESREGNEVEITYTQDITTYEYDLIETDETKKLKRINGTRTVVDREVHVYDGSGHEVRVDKYPNVKVEVDYGENEWESLNTVIKDEEKDFTYVLYTNPEDQSKIYRLGNDEPVTTDLIYSINGIDWIGYNAQPLNTSEFNNVDIIYLRSYETEDNLPSKVFKFEILKEVVK